MSEITIRALLLLIPVLVGLLLLRVTRNDRRRQFIQARLHFITAGNGVDEPAQKPSLVRHLQRAAFSGAVLPQKLRTVLNSAFEATGNSIRLLHLVIASLLGTIAAFLFFSRVLLLNPTLVTFITAAAAAAAPIVMIRFAQERYQQRFLQLFPEALDLVGRGVRAGLPVDDALYEAGREIADPVGRELRRALDEVQIGVPMIDALQEIADRIRIADFRFMVVALALQQRTGGSLAETLSNLSGVIRARKAIRLKARGLTAEAKVSAMILAILPFVVGALMYLLNRDLTRVLFVDRRGHFMLGISFLSLVMGLGVMYVIVKRALR